ncbi:glutathione S-transferase family protein [Komagataeibacter oboediens]|uniref:glutathione S-transferase family protein n=1 Tax=Komagataeibacter oboediens TaxID=65958 RepID=UPI001C2D3F3C|nr:glutathione S-transferase family protein [Komagataeibacter oboediens]MBV1824502.1 glutathione S-transferase family protein [Komagataeibacter oboediens]
MTTGLTLYDWTPDVRCYAVRLGLSLMGVAYDTQAADMDLPTFQRPAGLRPGERPPVLVAGDVRMTRPGTIMQFAARQPAVARAWLDPAHEWAILDWLDFGTMALDALAAARDLAFGTTLPVLPPMGALVAALRRMEDHMSARAMAGHEWFAAPAASIADVLPFVVFALSADLEVERDTCPALRRWAHRMRGLPGFVVMPGVPDYA